MSTPVQLRYEDNAGELPSEWQLPPGLSFQLFASSAVFDGSGAGGDFRPALAIYSQDDKLIGRYPASQTFTSGDSGEVTWSPFLGGEDSGTPGPPGPPGDYVLIDTYTVATDEAIEFTGISQLYKHLVVELLGLADDTGGEIDLTLTINGDGSASYGNSAFYIFGDTFDWVSPYEALASGTFIRIGDVLNGGQDNLSWTSVRIHLPYYRESGVSTLRNVMWQSSGVDWATAAGRILGTFGAGVWNNSDPITSLAFVPDGVGFWQGSKASLYGIR